MKHFIHPHALKLSESDEKSCSGCELEFPPGEEAYACPKRDCEFILHKSCFDLPRKIQHKSHPEHKLTLLTKPPESSLYYNCNACGILINAFSYHCDKCDIRLHPKCASLPETVDSKAHEHALSVRYYTTKPTGDEYSYYSIAQCDVCREGITEGYWSYFCKDCDFVTDLECAFTADAPPVKEEEDEETKNEEEEEEEEEYGEYPEGTTDEMRLQIARMKMEDQMQRLQLQMQMARYSANAMISSGRALANL